MTFARDSQRRQLTTPSPDALVARLANSQHGVVHRAQLIADDLPPRTIDRWLAAGRLHRIHRLVYAVGHTALPELGPVMAATLATARWDPVAKELVGSAASHTTAAELLRIRDPGRGVLHVVTETQRGARGVIVHETVRLDPADFVTVRGVRVTAWPRTLIDLAELLERRWLIRALERCAIRELYDHRVMMDAITRLEGRHGIAPLLSAIATGHHLDPQTTDSLLEDEFLFLMRGAEPAILQPQMQGRVRLSGGERYRIDALYRDLRVALELDSKWHDPAGPRMRDAARDQALKRDGYLTYRFRWSDVVRRPGWVVYIVRDLLQRASMRSGLERVS